MLARVQLLLSLWASAAGTDCLSPFSLRLTFQLYRLTGSASVWNLSICLCKHFGSWMILLLTWCYLNPYNMIRGLRGRP